MKEVERLGMHREEAEKDILNVPESDQVRFSGGLQSLLLPFRKQYRSRTILALFVLGMVQLSGIDGVLYVCCLIVYSQNVELTRHSKVRAYTFPASGITGADRRIPCLRHLSHPHVNDHCACGHSC